MSPEPEPNAPTPYQAAAHDYRRAGWQGVIPLPTGEKGPPPQGYTGSQGAFPSAADVQTWMDWNPELGNIALRLPPHIVGIDVDAYSDKPGGATLQQLEAQLGPLPPTVVSTARPDDISGIRLYQVPEHPSWSDPGPGIEIIHHGWRYLAVWPSVHPAGGTYRWINQATGEMLDHPPQDVSIPMLPEPWVAHMASDKAAAEKMDATDQEVLDWINQLPPGPPDKPVADCLDAFNTQLDEGVSRHDASLAPVVKLLRAGEQGHAGVAATLGQARQTFLAVVTTPGEGQRTQREAETEWKRGVIGAYQIIKADPRHTAPEVTTLQIAPHPSSQVDRNGLIDWAEFWTKDRTIQEWFCEPLLPRGRSISTYSPAKSGKSILSLDVAARMATGQPCLDQPAGHPQHVVYFDLEMTEDDLYERLEDMGYGPDTDLSHLHYYLLPALAPLDTAAGGQQVRDIARAHNADLVIIDTTSRVLSGPENDADTVRALYRHTGQLLKADGRTVWRLDHAGKDLTLGQRGTSAKNDDVDIVWKLTSMDSGTVQMKATHRRISWVPEEVDLKREEWPLRHVRVGGSWPAGTTDVAKAMDTLGLPLDISTRKAQQAVREIGHKARNDVVGAAVKYRREQAVTVLENRGDHLGDHLSTTSRDHFGDHTDQTPSDQRGSLRGSLGITSQGEWGSVPPPLRGAPEPTSADTPPNQPRKPRKIVRKKQHNGDDAA